MGRTTKMYVSEEKRKKEKNLQKHTHPFIYSVIGFWIFVNKKNVWLQTCLEVPIKDDIYIPSCAIHITNLVSWVK